MMAAVAGINYYFKIEFSSTHLLESILMKMDAIASVVLGEQVFQERCKLLEPYGIDYGDIK